MSYAHGGDYAENRGGLRHANNPLSFTKGEGTFYKATEKVLPWNPPGSQETEDRALVPSAYIEALFAHATVPHPERLKPVKFLVKCLGWDEFVGPGLDKLIEEGLLTEQGDDGDDVPVIFDDINDLYAKAAAIVEGLKDDPSMVVDETKFEWLEGFTNRAVDTDLTWFYGLDLEMLTATTKNLTLYVDLNFIVGPRSMEDARIEVGGTCHTMVATTGGGQLGQAIKTFYTLDQHVTTAFLLRRLVDFLADSAWPDFYQHHFSRWEDYAFDLPSRALWHTATRQQWAAIVQNKLARTLRRNMPTLHQLFFDFYLASNTLVREVQGLGDVLLQGEDAQKLPFYNLPRIETILAKDYAEVIEAERDEDSTTETILQKVLARAKAMKASEKGVGQGAAMDDMVINQGPKPGQMTRAFGVHAYVMLELKYLEPLQGRSMTVEDILAMFGDCFTSGTVLPHAVLFATKGTRMAVYIGQAGSDFMALLHAQRHLLPRFLGQSLAFDADAGAVPDTMTNFEFDELELVKLTEFLWDELDFLNGLFLKLMGSEVGTTFAVVTTANLYHRGDMLNYIQDIYGKLFLILGFAASVDATEGWTFPEFIGKIKRIQKYAIALPPDEQRGAYDLIDQYKRRAFVASAQDTKWAVYGPSPAVQCLRAWLKASESVYFDINETIKALADSALWRRRLGPIGGRPTVAAAPAGFGAVKGSVREADEPSRSASRKQKKKKAKAVAFAPGTKGNDGPAATKKQGKQPATSKATSRVTSGATGHGEVGAHVEKKAVFAYTNGGFSIGARHAPPRPSVSPGS
ncbi:hypothetical protein OAO87_01510 [bacterium]|nr:hypothetical protein [bacterium]